MNGIKIALALSLVTFLGATALALIDHGYVGFFEAALANSATRLLMLDLVITLTLATVWMVIDARSRGASVLPYLALTATFGAAGPLLYLLMRPEASSAVAAEARSHA